MNLCLCLDAFFAGASTHEALAQAAALGVRRVEFWDWRIRDVDALASAAEMQVVACSGNTFDEPLVDRGQHDRTLAHLRQSLRVAARLRTRMLVTHVGYAVPQRSRGEQWAAAVAGLRAAGSLAEDVGVTLVVEPLNSRLDHRGYFLDSLTEAHRMIDEVAHPAVRLLVDVYHMSLMHPNLLALLPEVLTWTGHVHLADVPGRGEPGSGTVDWPAVMRILRDRYDGFLGLECWPTGAPAQALRRCVEALGG